MRHLVPVINAASMASFGLLVVLGGLQVTAHEGQTAQPPSGSAEKSCGFDEVYQYEGWKIPGLAGSSPTKIGYIFPNAPGVTATRLTPGRTYTYLVILNCWSPGQGRLRYRRMPVKVLEMWRYDCQGKVFAYAAQCEPQSVYGGQYHSLLELVDVLFYDLDGSGKFVSMRYTIGILPKAPEVPEWVKRK
jgi:hypothetical protein